MRLVGAELLEAFPNAILNVHPSLLPAFPGVNAQQQAIRGQGLRRDRPPRDPELDAGPIVQACVPVRADDRRFPVSADSGRGAPHYPEAVRLVLAGGWQVDGRRFTIVH